MPAIKKKKLLLDGEDPHQESAATATAATAATERWAGGGPLWTEVGAATEPLFHQALSLINQTLLANSTRTLRAEDLATILCQLVAKNAETLKAVV